MNNNNNKLYIGNLPSNTSPNDLKEILSNVGIHPLRLLLRRNYALVDLPESIAKDDVILRLNGMYNKLKIV